MDKLLCPCLNITIHSQKGCQKEVEGKSFLSAASSSSFFAENVLEIKLGVGGITKEVPTLVNNSQVEDWDVYKCINCNVEVYALHRVKGYDRVLINKYLESNADAIKNLTSSSEFSSAFKIILKTSRQDQHNNEGYAVLVNRDRLVNSMNSIQEMIKKYLNVEEQAMEKRIQEYTEEQKRLFAALKSKAFQDKTEICRILSEMDASLMENSLQDAMNETAEKLSNNLNLKSLQMNQVSLNTPYGNITEDTSRPPFKFSVQTSSKSPVTQKKRMQTQKVNVRTLPASAAATDADPLFSLDGFNDDCEPFFESEEDELSSSDNSFQMEESTLPRHISAIKKAVYSSSVPISLPIGVKTAHSWEEDDDDHEIPEPSKIGESMKALARSVQYNTEELFGELPRPRLSTEPRLSFR